MKKFLPILAFCLKTAAALSLIYALIFILLTYGLATLPPTTGEFSLLLGNYGKNPIWMKEDGYTTVDDLYDAIDENDSYSKVAAAVGMYREALKRIAYAKKYSARTLGTISFEAAGLSGDVINTQVKNVERIGTPTLDPNHPSNTYYQNIVTAQNIGAEGIVKQIMESAITKGMREYSDACNLTREFGTNKIYIDETGGGAEWSGKQVTKTLKEDNKNGRQYDDPEELREICNFIIDESSILPDTVNIERFSEQGEDGADSNYYIIKFNLDCSNPTRPGSAVYYEAEAIRKQVGESLLKQLAYTEASLTLKIYDTGYLTDWSMTDTWEAIFKVLVDIDGKASMSQRQTISYKADEIEVHNFVGEKAA